MELDIECLDRVYLNAYVPILQSSGQVVAFMTQHLGLPIPSPALFDKIGQRFRRAVDSFAEANHIPWVKFAKDDRKAEVMGPYLNRAAATGRSGVVAIGVAQEFQRVWAAYRRETSTAAPQFTFAKADRRVTCYYFYLWDEDFGPAFIKVCAYFPYPAKIWVNGHEWAKRQAARAGIGFTELSNGFAACDDPAALQAICDRLQPGTIEVFAQRWLHRLPLPFGRADQGAGYWWEISMRQVEVSRTMVFDAPRRARAFFEALIADNLDIGRPANVEIIFGRRIRRDTRGVFRTAIDRPAIGPDTGGVVLNIFYKHSRIKQYLKDGRAMRIETVINAPRDLGCNARLPNLAELQAKARACNRRILEAERAGQGTVLASPAFERIAHPSVDADGRRTPALRFGDPRVMALAGALCRPCSRHRHHQQEPARLDDRTAARPLHPRPDDLRPAAAPPRRADPPDRALERKTVPSARRMRGVRGTRDRALGGAMPAGVIAGERIRAVAGNSVRGAVVLVAGPEGVRAGGSAGLADIAGQVPASPGMVPVVFPDKDRDRDGRDTAGRARGARPGCAGRRARSRAAAGAAARVG